MLSDAHVIDAIHAENGVARCAQKNAGPHHRRRSDPPASRGTGEAPVHVGGTEPSVGQTMSRWAFTALVVDVFARKIVDAPQLLPRPFMPDRAEQLHYDRLRVLDPEETFAQ